MISPTIVLAIWAALMTAVQAQPIIVLIGGNHSDPSPAQLAGEPGRGGNSGLWRLKRDLQEQDGLAAEYFNWNGTRAGQIDDPRPGGAAEIADFIRQRHARRPEAPILIVGNSWGGHTAWQVCQLLAGEAVPSEHGGQTSIDASASGRAGHETGTQPGSAAFGAIATASAEEPASSSGGFPPERSARGCGASADRAVIAVKLVVFLDPSSLGRSRQPMPARIPENVEQAINFYTHNWFGWRAWADDARVVNVDLGDPANGYVRARGPAYGSTMNFAAHVSAEWDERIHADIRRRIVAAITNNAGH